MRLAALGAAALVLAGGAGAHADDGARGSVRFAVKGDWGDGTPAQAAVTRRMCAESRRSPFAFVLTTGDNFSPDGRATVANYWRPERCLRAMGVRWRAAWGNHDILGTSTADVLGARRRYYAFAAGPARVIVLDANDPSDPGQMRFLRRELASAPEALRIVALHQPLQTAGVHPPSEQARRAWAPLFVRGGVALVLQGHNHLYERIEVDGVTYVTTAGGGAPLYPCLRPTAGLRACAIEHHFVIVTATAHAAGLRVVTPRGRTIERVRIPVRPS